MSLLIAATAPPVGTKHRNTCVQTKLTPSKYGVNWFSRFAQSPIEPMIGAVVQ